MPVVLRRGRYTVKIYGPPREHAPPHVHVFVGAMGIVIVRLPLDDAGTAPVMVRDVEGPVRDRDVRGAVTFVQRHAAFLLTAWHRLHG